MSRTDPIFQRILSDGITARDVIGLNAEKFLAKVIDTITETPQPSYHANGVGYWVVRSRTPSNVILQGIGHTQNEAWEEWRKLHATHNR